MRNAFWRYSYLRYAFSHYAFLRYAFSRYVYWHYAYLRDAFSRYAFSRNAYLRYAFSRYTFLHYTFSRDAYLRYAFLRYAFLRYAYLRYAFSRYAFYHSLCLKRVFALQLRFDAFPIWIIWYQFLVIEFCHRYTFIDILSHLIDKGNEIAPKILSIPNHCLRMQNSWVQHYLSHPEEVCCTDLTCHLHTADPGYKLANIQMHAGFQSKPVKICEKVHVKPQNTYTFPYLLATSSLTLSTQAAKSMQLTTNGIYWK